MVFSRVDFTSFLNRLYLSVFNPPGQLFVQSDIHMHHTFLKLRCVMRLCVKVIFASRVMVMNFTIVLEVVSMLFDVA